MQSESTSKPSVGAATGPALVTAAAVGQLQVELDKNNARTIFVITAHRSAPRIRVPYIYPEKEAFGLPPTHKND
jgi:hypothetical protein